MEQQKEKEDKSKQKSAEPVKSTTEEVTVYQSDLDEDVLILRIDAKHPARRKIFAAVQGALEGAERNEEAVRVKAYAQEKLPDDWRRRQTSQEPVGAARSQAGEIRKPAK